MEADKRTRILGAAVTVFCRDGLEGASMDQIAREAGVAKGTLYLYFQSKDDLIEQACELCSQQDVAACQQGLDALDGAVAKLTRRLENVTRWALANPNAIQMERLYYGSPMRRRMGRYQNQPLQVQALGAILRAGIASGELRALPAALLGEIFFGIGEAVLNYVTEYPEKAEDRAFWATCGQMIAGCMGNTDGNSGQMPVG